MQIPTYVCFYRLPAYLGTCNIHILPGLHGQRIRRRHRRPYMGRRFRRTFVFFLQEAGVDTADGPAGNRHPKGRSFAIVIFCYGLRVRRGSKINIMRRCQGNVLPLYGFANGFDISFRCIVTADSQRDRPFTCQRPAGIGDRILLVFLLK